MACQGHDQNIDSLEGYEPPQCLWSLVKQHVPELELPEIRAVLGEALVDLYTEMYAEVEMWRQVWREARGKQGFGSRTPQPALADPPAIKELLRDEIRLLLLAVRDVANGEGRDGDAITSKFSPIVVNYAMAGRQQEAPGGAPEVRSSSGPSRSSTREDDIKAIKDKLNMSDIDEVVAHLKSVLAEECETLKRDIRFLQDCVEKCFLDRSEELRPEPTVSELREERRRIERELQLQSHLPHPRHADRAAVDGGLTYKLRSTQRMALSAPDLVPETRSSSPPPSKVGWPPTQPKSGLPTVKRGTEHRPPDGAVRHTTPTSVLVGSGHTPGSSLCFHGDESARKNCSNPCSGSHGRPRALLRDHRPRPMVSASSLSSATLEGRPHVNSDLDLRKSATETPRRVRPGPRSASPSSVADGRPRGRRVPLRSAHPLPPASRAKDGGLLSSRPFLPSPPETQRPASRGQSVSRRLRLPEANGLVSPT